MPIPPKPTLNQAQSQAQNLTPEGLANQLFDAAISQALAQNVSVPSEAARWVIQFLTSALFYAVKKDLHADVRTPHGLSPSRNSYRWDEIGSYIVSTVRLPESFTATLAVRYETLVYSSIEGQWNFDASGVQSSTGDEADYAHAAACDRVMARIQ
jgi:hypothetical protein